MPRRGNGRFSFARWAPNWGACRRGSPRMHCWHLSLSVLAVQYAPRALQLFVGCILAWEMPSKLAIPSWCCDRLNSKMHTGCVFFVMRMNRNVEWIRMLTSLCVRRGLFWSLRHRSGSRLCITHFETEAWLSLIENRPFWLALLLQMLRAYMPCRHWSISLKLMLDTC